MHRHFWDRHEHHSRHGWGGHMRDHLRGARHGGGRGGRIGRLLEHGDLRFVVLALVSEKPRHGYEIIRELEERTGGSYRPSPGVVYPTFSLLEDEGFVRAIGDEGGRKAYEITQAGREALDANRAGVDAIFSRLDEAGAQSTGARPRIQRAMQNLHTALALRLRQGEISEAQVDAIAAALDDAAAKIERV
ncbi:MAG TPA: PadR family transcriptional regulator [Phenylobacterium sp.]|uniref:PadR family transcriptional regulator n=1 Tax=Phenylobacterium conjunctum TaxID=1298959 RepID=A0ABW3T4Y1_9CAUL|nr:PadR family transcriptional regulator [Phenylobacterium sp.]